MYDYMSEFFSFPFPMFMLNLQHEEEVDESYKKHRGYHSMASGLSL